MFNGINLRDIDEAAPLTRARRLREVAPAGLAAIYPFIVLGFRASVAWPEGGASVPRIALAALFLIAMFAVPAAGPVFAFRSARAANPSAFRLRARRLAYLTVAVPPLFVFSGVLFGWLELSPSRNVIWFLGWIALGLWVALGAAMGRDIKTPARAPRWLGTLRVSHGIGAAVILAFVLFHIVNHLFSLAGPETHTAIMDAGRKIYRAPFLEPVLVTLFLFQVVSGLRLAWTWSALPVDGYRVFQIVSGVYMSFFILTHMNTIFIYARGVEKIQTDWAFMTGLPAGLIHGSIYLVPHYALGVFFVLSHLASGLRHVAITHGVSRTAANRLWGAGLAGGALVATAIMCGITGVRIAA